MKVHFNLTSIVSSYMTCWFCQVNCIKAGVKDIRKTNLYTLEMETMIEL
jgi:hypothetical protein